MSSPSLSRRDFFSLSATAAGGFILGANFPLANAKPRDRAAAQFGLYIRLDPDNRLTLHVPAAEMGQGVQTAFAMVLAEEMDADWSLVKTELLPLSVKPIATGIGLAFQDAPQGAGGSFSVISAWPFLRKAGAQARDVLIRAAAQTWNVPVPECSASGSIVTHAKSSRRASFGELAKTAATLSLADAPTLKDRSKFKLLGSDVKNEQAKAIVTGAAEFGIDFVLPGMVYATVVRAPAFDSRIATIDDSAVRKLPGIIDVVRLDGPKPEEPYDSILASGVAIVAKTLWQALKARDALKVTWTESPWKNESSASLRAQAGQLLDTQGKGQITDNQGDVDAALKSAHYKIERRFEVPYLAHATLEPQNCVAHFKGDSIDVYAPTQFPMRVARSASLLTGVNVAKISVTLLRMGGGFGRRLETDFTCEAILISRAVKKPVKLIWTREDDLRNDFYRPVAFHRIALGFDAKKNLVAWRHQLATAAKNHRRSNTNPNELWKADLYEGRFPNELVANYQREFHQLSSGAPRRSWRAPADNSNSFAEECVLDEAAHEIRVDPLTLRLSVLAKQQTPVPAGAPNSTFNPERLAGVLKLAAQKAGWGESLPMGRGRGIAGYFTFTSYCAHVVDVSVSPAGDLMVDRVVSAIDCGLALNPLGIRAQVEGGIIDALSAALGQEITIEAGAVVEGNFDTYQLLRIDKAPAKIEVHIVPSPAEPTGVGEPPLPPFAPALCNAIFAATGKRIRRLPIGDQLQTA